MTAPSIIDPKTLADALRIQKEQDELRTRGLDKIREQRNLMLEMVKISKDIGVQFDVHSKNIGSAVTEMSKLDKLNVRISARTKENNSLEYSYMEQMKEHHEEIISKKSIIANIAKEIEVWQKMGYGSDLGVAALQKELNETIEFAKEQQTLRENNLKKTAEEIELNRTKIAQLEELAAGERVRQSMSDKFFGSTFTNLAKSDFGKAMGLDKVLAKFPLLSMVLNGVIKLIQFAFETFKQFDLELFNLRKHFGLFRDQNKEQEKIVTSIAQKYAAQGVTILESSAAAKALSNQFGRLSANSGDIVGDVALISTQLGISAEQSAKFLGSIATLSGKTLPEAAEISFGFAQSLNEAAGTNLPDVMSDIASMSDTVSTTFRGNTVELIKATVEARRFGLSLESVGKTSESLLAFNSSVNDEMEASVLLGRNINLMEARKAAFAGDYKKQQAEILKVVKSVGDFDKLNYMQKTALAKAVSMSVVDLQTMLQREKEIEHVRQKGSPHAKKMLETYEKMANMRKDEIKDLEKDFMLRIKREQNQERMKAIQDNINKLMMDLSSIFLPLINLTLKGVVFLTGLLANGLGEALIPALGFLRLMDHLARIMAQLGTYLKKFQIFKDFPKLLKPLNIFSKVAEWVRKIGSEFNTMVGRVTKPLTKLGIFKSVVGWVKNISTAFGSVGELKFLKPLLNFLKLGKLGLKAIPVLGEVIMALEAIWGIGESVIFLVTDIFKSFKDAEGISGFFKALGKSIMKTLTFVLLIGPKLIKDIFIKPIIELIDWMFGTSLGESIMNGISSISSWLGEALGAPFKNAFDWIVSFFGGNSPSLLGLKIVDGIKSVGGLLYDILVLPFKGAFDFIISIFKKGIDFIMKLPGIGTILKFVGNKLGVNVNSDKNVDGKTSENKPEDNQRILDKLDELINLMKSGGISVNLDGRKVSEMLSNASR